jgi:hypothetical protein
VSLPWNESLRLRVDPGAVAATLRAGWPRRATTAEVRRRVERAAAPVPGGDSASVQDPSRHAEAIEAVLQEIASHTPLRGAALSVELSSAIVHLDVVDGDFAGRTDRQLHDIAIACVAELLGDAAADHEVRWQLQRDDRHLLICAIARSQLSMFDGLAQAFGMRLASVRPQFVVHWNEFGRAVEPGRCVFAVSAACDLAIASVVDGAISSISIGPGIDIESVDAPGDESLASAVDRVYSKPDTGLFVTGSTATARGAFSPVRALPPNGIDALDARVDRLLFGSGQDPADQSAFVLVTPDSPSIAASSRWSVMGQPEAQA